MTDQSLQQLESPDPAVRRQAILDAGRTGDKRALPYLAKIYKSDPDPVIRELALKAGRRIKTLLESATADAAAPAAPAAPPAPIPARVSYDDYVYTPAPTVPPTAPPPASTAPIAPIAPITPLAPTAPIAPAQPRKAVSPRTREMAKTRVDTAITFKLQNDTERALVALAEALHLNPDLETDQLVINLATSLTGLPAPAEAMEVVKRTPTSAKPARPKAEGSGVDTPLTNTLLEVLIYFALTVVLSLIVLLIISRQSDATFEELTRGQSRFTSNPLRGLGFMIMMVAIFITAAFSTLGTLISNTLYYAVGIPLGGTGDWTRVISAMLRVQIGGTILGSVLMGINLALFATPPTPGTYAFTQWNQAIEVMGGLYLLVAVGVLGVMAYMIGKAHNFGFARGLATIVAGTVLQCCACILLTLAAAPSLRAPTTLH